jgi:hypothetical protein
MGTVVQICYLHLLALHTLVDSRRHQGLNFIEYLDHFLLLYLNRMRGMNHTVLSNWWSYLPESELRTALQHFKRVQRAH